MLKKLKKVANGSMTMAFFKVSRNKIKAFFRNVTLLGILWSMIYTVFIYPPKYIVDFSFLDYFCPFNEFQNERGEIVGGQYCYLNLHLGLRNIHRGQGDIKLPMLVITNKNTRREYILYPDSYYGSDSERTIHVGPYGIIDKTFSYQFHDRSEAIEFLETDKDKLKFETISRPHIYIILTASEILKTDN